MNKIEFLEKRYSDMLDFSRRLGEVTLTKSMRTSETGGTRNPDDGKNDYEGFLSPLVIERFGDYMTVHRVQSDGVIRDSDNWQKGMPQEWYIKSLWRHFMDLWKLHRGHIVTDKTDGHNVTKEEACCAILFNVQGYLHVELTDNKIVPE